MGLYLEKAIFVNRAPFEHLEIDFKKNGINVLSAINGMGKTTIISHIVDAFHEMARPYFSNSYEGVENKYYRFSSPLFQLDSNKYSLVYLRFYDANNEIIDYIDCRGIITSELYEAVITLKDKIPYHTFEKAIKDRKCVKTSSKNYSKAQAIDLFGNNIITYFPSYRYEQPIYLNDPYKIQLSFNVESEFNDTLPNPIEVISGLPQLANWIMDVVLDWEVYKQTQKIQMPNGDIKNIDTTPEALLFRNLNKILSLTLSSKKYIGNIRFGIGKRTNGGQRISIINDIDKSTSHSISPNIFSLSSGESALLSMFGEILRQGDKLIANARMGSLTGIVLIDEVDKHLHVTLQKEVLPKLFNLFPNVQFIVSSHSPFLNMGLADEALNRTQIIDLDNNGVVCEPTNNELYKEVYDMMVNENQRFADKYRTLEGKIKAVNKPVIITEGKTDWKHLKAALSFFKENGMYEDLEVEILEYDFDFGDSKLHSLLNQYKLFPHKYIVIGVFDCDEANGRNIHTAGGIKKYGENIWGISIPIPDFRSYNTSGISIEFLYKDIDLKKEDANGRRIYITSEFNENGRLTSNLKIGVKNHHDVKSYITREKEKVQADEVIDIEGNSLALSKEDFASNILAKDGVFATVCFDAFKPIFDKIKDVLDRKIH